jgi:hypothetical protein
MVDWYYIFSILRCGVYPSPQSIYNVGAKRNKVYMGKERCKCRGHAEISETG